MHLYVIYSNDIIYLCVHGKYFRPTKKGNGQSEQEKEAVKQAEVTQVQQKGNQIY